VIPLTDSFVTLISALIFAIDLFLLTAFSFAAYHLWQQRRYLLPHGIFTRILYPLRPLLGVIVCPLLIVVLRRLQIVIPGISHPAARIWIGTFVVLLLSLLLFVAKIKLLRYYAILEGIFAVGVCVQTLSTMRDQIQPAQSFALLTSAYLIIRAMDNFKKDWDARRAKI
jgi:hypothetical protein